MDNEDKVEAEIEAPEEAGTNSEEEVEVAENQSVGGGVGEENSSQVSDEKSEEKALPPTPPKTVRLKIGEEEKEFTEDDLTKVLLERDRVAKLHKEGTDLHNAAKYVLGEIARKPKEALLDIFTGTLRSKEAAQEHLLRLADEIVKEQLTLATMPEADRKVIQLQQELAERDKKIKEHRAAEQERLRAVEEAKKVDQYFREITEAIKGTPGMSDDVETFDRMANVMVKVRSEGHEVSAKEIAALVMKETQEKERIWEERRLKEVDKLINSHPELVKKIREIDLSKLREERERAKTPKGEPREREEPRKQKVVDSVELRKALFG